MLATLRRFRRDPLTAIVTVGGLAVALAAVLLIALYVRFESTYDRFLPDHGQLYRMSVAFVPPGQPAQNMNGIPSQIARILANRQPELEAFTRAGSSESGDIRVDDRTVNASALTVDANFLEVLRFPLVAGASAETALAAPNSAVLTESFARSLFGDADPIGRTVASGEGQDARELTVTAVMRDVPRNSQFRFQALFADAGRATSWAAMAGARPSVFDTDVYLRLPPGADPVALAKRIDADFGVQMGVPPDSGVGFPIGLLRLADVHLSGNTALAPRGADRETLTMLAGIAALILIVAVVNSTNLMTAQALKRGVEVGIRKTLGAPQARLLRDYLLEALATTSMAVLLALGLVELALPAFSDLVQRDGLSLGLLPPLEVGGFILAVAVVAAGLGGVYPALVMARWRPDDVFRGRGGPRGASWVRTVLGVAQFAIAIGLIVATVTVLRQVEHARDSLLVAAPESLVIGSVSSIRDPSEADPTLATWVGPSPIQMETLRAELLGGPGILGVSTSKFHPLGALGFGNAVPMRRTEGGEEVRLPAISVDPDFQSVYALPLIVGQGLRDRPRPDAVTHAADEAAALARRKELSLAKREGRAPSPAPQATPRTDPAIVTAAAARRLGFADPAAALGALVSAGPNQTYEIVGVTADIALGNARSPQQEVLFHARPAGWSYLAVRLAAGDPRPALDHIAATAKAVMPERQIYTRFLDELLDETYRRELRQARIFGIFGTLAILLAAVGLFATTALAVAGRTREIGIRRVLGARPGDLVGLMVRDFAKPVLLANLLAWPVAWYALSRWLEQYVVRVDQAPWVFAAAGGGVLLLASGIVALHAARVGLSSPSRALRTE